MKEYIYHCGECGARITVETDEVVDCEIPCPVCDDTADLEDAN